MKRWTLLHKPSGLVSEVRSADGIVPILLKNDKRLVQEDNDHELMALVMYIVHMYPGESVAYKGWLISCTEEECAAG